MAASSSARSTSTAGAPLNFGRPQNATQDEIPAKFAPRPGSAKAAGLNLSRGSTAPTSPAPTTSSTPAGASLSLGGKAPASSAQQGNPRLANARQQAALERNEQSKLFPAPGMRELYELNLSDRVLRLTPLESSVGTLEITGSTAIAWESERKVVGGADSAGHTAGTPVGTSGNRPLATYLGNAAVIPLRHVRELRRALAINRGNTPMGIRLPHGASVAVPPPANGQQIVVLILRIGNVLEFRTESLPLTLNDQDIWAEFDFTMTLRAPVSSYRR